MCLCDEILKVCEHVILQTACGSFTEYTTYVQLGTKMYQYWLNWLHFEVTRSKVKVTLRLYIMIESTYSKMHLTCEGTWADGSSVKDI